MLKRTIKYENFDGEMVEEDFYFNISNSEFIELEASNIQELLQRIVKTEDKEGLIREFKALILKSYGVKSDDGKRFIKNQELCDEFVQTAAFDSLFLELVTDEEAASTFVLGILPKDIMKKIEEAEKAQPQDKPTGPPPVPNR